MEAQACYSLGNTYTLLQQYERAIDYHLKHLYIAQELTDRYCLKTIERKPNKWPQEQVFFNVVRSLFHRVGEGRACWSLGNAYVSLGNHKQALYYARKHLEISKEVRKLYKCNNIKRPLAFYVIFFCLFVPDFIRRLETEMVNWQPGWTWISWWRPWGSLRATFHPQVQSLRCKVALKLLFFCFFYMKGNVVMLDFVFRIYFIDVESWEIIVTVDKAWKTTCYGNMNTRSQNRNSSEILKNIIVD